MANFFIDRPIFAIALAIAIMVAGALSIFSLPVEQYPSVAPPSIQISSTYPGASAETVESTVVQVIEQQMSGLDHLIYLSSTSDNFGNGVLTLTFAAGTNPDIAQVQVQNKLSLALPLLPQQVQQLGISVTKSSSSFLLVAGFVSTDGSMSKFDIANYVVSHVQDPVSRLNGVGNFSVFGTQYAMRIWLDAAKLNSVQLTPVDVTNALLAQNIQVSAGQLGGTPAPTTQRLNAAITEATLLRTPAEFERILLKVNPDGSRVLLRDVARIELGAENYNVDNKYNGKPAAGIGFQLASGSNALATADAIKARIAELSKYFPPGLQVVYPYDTTPFIRISISEVVKTLFEGVVLVVLVILLFLQNVRATLIPAVAIPVVLLGTFGVMAAVGFTINTLTMFGLVLAIGLLVDDAIVVVENVERVIAEEGLSPREATRKAMGQITGALVGVALVLSAVFVPMAFSSGSVGAIYRQFSLTIVVGDAAVGVRRALAHSGAVRHDAQARPRRASGDEALVRLVQPLVRAAARPVRARRADRDRPARALPRDLRRADRRGRVALRATADVLPADRGPGLHVRPGADAAGRDAGVHRHRARRRQQLSAAGRSARGRRDVPGERLQFRRPRPEPGPGVRAVQGLVPADGRRR